MTSQRVAVVTGGNKGLGYALVKFLCKEWNGSGKVYLTARNVERGQAAVESLKREGYSPEFFQLDISVPDHIEKFSEHIKEKHGGLDIFIQNAAAASAKGSTMTLAETAEMYVKSNNYGTVRIMKKILPLLRKDGRVVIVASGFGQLSFLGPNLQPKFLSDDLTMDGMLSLMDDYVASVADDTYKEKGWPELPNKSSKIGQVALTRIISRQLRDDPRDIIINAACPGWTITDAAKKFLDENNCFRGIQAKTPDESAAHVGWLALLPPGTQSPRGDLVQYKKIIPFTGGNAIGFS